MKNICSNCGKKVDKDFKFCPFCFQDFEKEPDKSEGTEDSSTEKEVGQPDEKMVLREDERGVLRELPPPGKEKELIIAKKYKIIEPLHSSAYGTVCMARDISQPDRIVVLRDFLLKEREPQKKTAILSKFGGIANKFLPLAHSNLASIHEYLSEDNYLYLVFDYIRGKFIDIVFRDYHLKKGEDIPEDKILQWGYQLTELLTYVHTHLPAPECCINLKPYSLMIRNSDSHIVYLHLGLVEFCEILGYLDPYEQQLIGYPKENYSIYEIFSLGGVLYYFATGIDIFKGEPYISLEEKRKDFRPEFVQIIKRLLLSPQKLTFASFNDIKTELQKLLPKATVTICHEGKKADKPEIIWHDFLGNKHRTNSIGNGPAYPLQIKWRTSVSPSMQNFIVPHREVLLSLSDRGNLFAIDYQTGHIRKKESLNINPVTPIVVGDQLCICSSSTQLSINIADLSKKWDFRTKSMILCAPSFINGNLCYIAYDGILIFVNLNDGKALSMENLGAKIIATPSFDDKRLYIPTLSGSMVSISLSERTILWQQNTKSAISSSPALLKDRLFVGNNKGRLFSMDKVTGEIKWELPLKGAVSQPVRAMNDRIFALSSGGDFWAIDAEKGSKLWTLDLKCHKDCPFAVTEKIIYLINPENYVILIDTETGAQLYQYSLLDKPNGVPLVLYDVLYVTLSNGEILAFKQEK